MECVELASRQARQARQDARIVRTSDSLRNALLRLLDQKPLEQITIREIAAEAGIHYTTFFRHHTTKEALLDDLAADQIARLVELSLPVLDAADTKAAFAALCSYVDEHRVLWTALLTGGAAGTMREELLRVSRRLAVDLAPRDSWLPVELAVNCSVSLIVETLAWWLAQPPERFPPEAAAELLHRLIASSTMQLSPRPAE